MSLQDKVAIVTGAGRGIGRATSLAFARAGASLVLVDVDGDAAEGVAVDVRQEGVEAIVSAGDVTRSPDVQRYVAGALEAFGRIDVLFNNAGIEGFVGPLHEYPEEAFDQVIAVNLRGVFLGLRHVLPVMVEQRSGAVINTASIAAQLGLPGTGAYNAAKHGVVGLTKTAAAEVGAFGVRVNAICPGVIDTAMTKTLAREFDPDDPDAAWNRMAAWSPLERFGEADEIASVVRFLASDEARYVTGAAWLVDGGVVATR